MRFNTARHEALLYRQGLAMWPLLRRLLCASLFAPCLANAAWVWVEGEKPAQHTMNRHPWWYDQVKRDVLSGGDFISNFDKDKPGEATYSFDVPKAGEYVFWIHGNPVKSHLLYGFNGADLKEVDLAGPHLESLNIAADDKPDLRFVAWIRAGAVQLKQGKNEVKFRMQGELSNHGLLDCFVLANEPFTPRGTAKPDQMADLKLQSDEANRGWFAFDPPEDQFSADSGINLRFLNEAFAGEKGRIISKGGRFMHSSTGEPVRFWAVNGPPPELKGEPLRTCARVLAKYGVNLVRMHGAVYDSKTGVPDPALITRLQERVAAMRAEGIYSHLSIYFPLWFTPKPGLDWLDGYDGNKNPFAALYFNDRFEAKYRDWWLSLLTQKDAGTGKTLLEEPALMSVEIVNEDSYFFWTFSEANIPDPQMRLLEAQFGSWLGKKYGSPAQALAAWKGERLKRDAPEEGRIAFRPLWNMCNDKSVRDQDTAAFLLESQRGFYQRTCEYLRKIGFKGLITCSNWTTASAEILGPLEKYSYTAGDFIDRHGYFGCAQKGDNAAWSLRDGHTYMERSALRFDPEEPGKPKMFNHPAMDVHYNQRPSMISETTFNRPNRYRSEAPLFFAAYGALQGSDGIVHFALDGVRWDVKPQFWMQPWTLMSPSQMGQFPAAALVYRRGLLKEGDVLAELRLKLSDLLALKGTPLPQDASFDELRLADVPAGATLKPGSRIDPLIHFAGRTSVVIDEQGGPAKLVPLGTFIDRAQKIVRSSTGQLTLDYGRGLLTLDAPQVQGAVGALNAAPSHSTADIAIETGLDLGAFLAVSLDGRPLATSSKILLQVMSEEKATGFETRREGALARIVSIGKSPWMVRELQGTVRFKRPDAARLKVTRLDANGDALKPFGNASEIRLAPDTLYYRIEQ